MSELLKTVLQVLSTVAALTSVGLGVWLGVKWAPPRSRFNARPVLVGMTAVGLGMLALGNWMGLVWTPTEREMGDVYRIIYVHVPAMWMAMLALVVNFACCVGYLLQSSWKTDALAEATAEVGLLFGTYGLVLGSIWGKPTWGTYWDWDPRLTAMAIMLVTYVAYMALRRFVEDPEKRAVWSLRGGHHLLHQPAHRVVLGEVVAEPAPGAVHAEDGGPGHDAGAARQRLGEPHPPDPLPVAPLPHRPRHA
ncbi:cytochrome c biogenesis protein [Archangium gephyra]|uniref:cytochrome c biogenesis protein n=1 Tax=Archangium gephyra TaxID=48 RepID=UPI003B769B5A